MGLIKICREWNKAEKAIKLAEQVSGKIINPSIYELRYAGRRIIEAFDHLRNGDKDKTRRLLRDALFDCLRARHDAVDAATTKIAADLDLARQRLGARSILANFSDFPQLLGELSEVRDNIANSREKRDDRDAIYQTIQDNDLTEIIRLYRNFQASEPLIKSAARRERLLMFVSLAIGIGCLIVGIVSWYIK